LPIPIDWQGGSPHLSRSHIVFSASSLTGHSAWWLIFRSSLKLNGLKHIL
jgi:hypothetical protein